ncbi:XdhC family protein [Tahibacter harae]|uniref:XdhC/CoxI family protein n=1 Tax=Tahibacter harae TaxID=2963937 RepID=A0ABT1QWY2_9GAMM|nr:XdhC/CoxI family protein [Tahibacter harae]MCQ4166766.1 XdhC/CoxI family protein [Tahibacter harae]
MDEALFSCLAQWLAAEPVVLATVTATRGATPRKAGSRMLIARGRTAWSVGGGLAEARVTAAARQLLSSDGLGESLEIDLGGGSGAAGICGGSMQLELRRWHGAADLALAQRIAGQLQAGHAAALPAETAGAVQWLRPNPRLLIVGAGHCGAALYQLARQLDFNIWIFDSRGEVADPALFAGATVFSGDYARLAMALDTGRTVDAVLLNRDFHADIATLDVLCHRPPRFIGMMGSRRRIREVVEALPHHAAALQRLQAPVGIEIQAETPQEIAVSILAQLIQVRRAG